MDSKSLEKYGFKDWHLLNKLAISEVLYKQEGVYVIKSKISLQRRVGKSDILYIGSSDNLVRRIFGNYLGGVGGGTTQRIHKLLFEEGYLEKTDIGWALTKEFRKLEKDLKMEFEREHRELPPWNKQL